MSDLSRALQAPWPDLRLQREAVGLGMWFFLASEVLFFAALFCSYAVYRSFNEEAFRIAASHTKIVYGSINTALLLTSSLTMTVALRAAAAQLKRMTLFCLGATAALGAAFLVTKGLEYRADIEEHLIPGPNFPLKPAATAMFWGLYWIMTGIHAIHLTAGIGVVIVVLTLFWRETIPVQGSTMEGVAIYWHFVDTVWIFLFPLIYLAGRS
ncbi:MAG: cytochrome c oxidase subunit 3 [Bradyrhizobium sp.]|nr:cytochrome c oxidase subunit 3 [Bradyrhizobium sp.]